jgi:molybdopterin synthase sulfur carrier subunit
MTAIRIPPVLRAATDGAKHVEIAGTTVREVIERLVDTYPAIADQLRAPDGELNRFVNVFVNGTDVRHLQALDTPFTDHDQLVLLPAMDGV